MKLLPRAEFAYNNSINRSTSKSPFKIVHGYKPRRPIDLIPLPSHVWVFESFQSFAQYIKELHKEINKKIQLSNEEYKHKADSHKRTKEFNEGDLVMIKFRQKRFPSSTMKKLHARGAGSFKIIKKIGPNAYVLELPSDFGISSTFNIFDLKEYIEPALIPSEPFEPDPIFESETPTECPPAVPPSWRDRVKRILDDQAIVTRNKGYQHYLVRW